jgi:para-nitrobenzyl esterase
MSTNFFIRSLTSSCYSPSATSTTRQRLPVFLALLLASLAALADGPVILTQYGAVQGSAEADMNVFRGVPFAAPPVGDLRFAPTQPHPGWTGVRQATEFGSPCPQDDPFGAGRFGNEDCLFLNVWSPELTPHRPMPVMLWLHGGSNTSGAGSDPSTDGQHLARDGDVVVVSINYRLTSLGFLAHTALTAERPDHPYSGNQGLEDQIAAMKWIRDNIGEFGGDPGNVTLFGLSAGGSDISAHQVAPSTWGLFHRVMMHSGVSQRAPTLAEASAHGDNLATAVGCAGAPDVLVCLRATSVDNLLDAGQALGRWGPITDGVLVPQEPFTAYLKGEIATVPTVLGTTANEGTLFLIPGGLPAFLVPLIIQNWFGTDAAAVLEQYPCSDADCSAYEPAEFLITPADNALSAVITDEFHCNTRRIARLTASAGAPTYVYEFERTVDPSLFPWKLGATHAGDQEYIFGTNLFNGPSAEKAALSATMREYFSSFADHGEPKEQHAPDWPKYKDKSGKQAPHERYLELDVEIEANRPYAAVNNCEFWDALRFPELTP